MLWPLPRGSVKTSRTFTSFLPDRLRFVEIQTPSSEVQHQLSINYITKWITFEIPMQTRDLMNEAINIYIDQIKSTSPASFGDSAIPSTSSTFHHQVNVRIFITSSSDIRLKLTTEESYHLVVNTTPEHTVNNSCNN